LFYNLIEDHLKILVFGTPLFLNAVNLFLDANNVIILLANVHELSLETVCMLLGSEEELAVIERLLLIHFNVHLLTIVFLPHGQLVILVNKNLTLPLKFLKVIKQRFVDLLDAVNDNADKYIIRT